MIHELIAKLKNELKTAILYGPIFGLADRIDSVLREFEAKLIIAIRNIKDINGKDI